MKRPFLFVFFVTNFVIGSGAKVPLFPGLDSSSYGTPPSSRRNSIPIDYDSLAKLYAVSGVLGAQEGSTGSKEISNPTDHDSLPKQCAVSGVLGAQEGSTGFSNQLQGDDREPEFPGMKSWFTPPPARKDINQNNYSQNRAGCLDMFFPK